MCVGAKGSTHLTSVVHHNGVVSSHADLRDVLIHCSFAVPDSGNILDDNHVVRLLPWTVQDIVGAHHVIHYIALGDLSEVQSVDKLIVSKYVAESINN